MLRPSAVLGQGVLVAGDLVEDSLDEDDTDGYMLRDVRQKLGDEVIDRICRVSNHDFPGIYRLLADVLGSVLTVGVAIEEDAPEEFGDPIAEGRSAQRSAKGLNGRHRIAVRLWVVRVGEHSPGQVCAYLREVGDGAAAVAAEIGRAHAELQSRPYLVC